MRKNLLSTVAASGPAVGDSVQRSEYAMRGASKSMRLSIDEMAENSKRFVEGEQILSLAPQLIDPSFLRDRFEEDEVAFEVFKDGIRQRGQLQPILVRPHPERAGRYMIVFGHRRTRAARELGIPVRAVVKDVEEIAHILAQGQENSRRSELTFIEKALLCRKLLEMGQTRETIKEALTVDDTLLSRMLSIVETVPLTVIDAIGSANGVGRDRWEALKKIVVRPQKAELARKVIGDAEFAQNVGSARFDYVLAQIKGSGKAKKARPNEVPVSDRAGERIGLLRPGRSEVLLKLVRPEGAAFSRFLQERLPSLFDEFKTLGKEE